MKAGLKIATIAILFLFGLNLAGNAQDKKDETIKIKTSAICGSCKTRIEKGLSEVKGIKEAKLDLETKIVTVKYAPSATSPADIRKAVSMLGYDADEVKADPKAYAKLPQCCKEESLK